MKEKRFQPDVFGPVWEEPMQERHGYKMEFSKDELKEAKRQIDSTLHKLRETVKTFESKEYC